MCIYKVDALFDHLVSLTLLMILTYLRMYHLATMENGFLKNPVRIQRATNYTISVYICVEIYKTSDCFIYVVNT